MPWMSSFLSPLSSVARLPGARGELWSVTGAVLATRSHGLVMHRHPPIETTHIHVKRILFGLKESRWHGVRSTSGYQRINWATDAAAMPSTITPPTLARLGRYSSAAPPPATATDVPASDCPVRAVTSSSGPDRDWMACLGGHAGPSPARRPQQHSPPVQGHCAAGARKRGLPQRGACLAPVPAGFRAGTRQRSNDRRSGSSTPLLLSPSRVRRLRTPVGVEDDTSVHDPWRYAPATTSREK